MAVAVSPAIDRSPAPVAAKHPCAKCPWLFKYRGDADYLRPGRRAEIITSTETGGEFPCHEAVDYDNEHDGEVAMTGAEKPCVGFDLMMVRAGHMNQMQRIRHRIGEFDPDDLQEQNRHVSTWSYTEALYELDDDEEEIETCHVSGDSCNAPAEYMIGGSVVVGTDEAGYTCSECGEPVCFACSIEDVDVMHGGGRVCDYCAEEGGE